MRITFIAVIIVSMVLLVSATVWEGVAEADSAGEVPGNYNVATNSFPRNTVVDITNLENGKMVRVKVVSGLESGGLLAMLSRTAAESIDLYGNFSVRIRMTQPPDDIAFSIFNLGPIVSPSSLATAPGSAESALLEGSRADATAFRASAYADTPAETYAAGTGAEINVTREFTAAATNGDAIANGGATIGTGNTGTMAEHSGVASEGIAIAADNANLPYNEPYNTPYNTPYNETEIVLSPMIAPIQETPAGTAEHYGEAGVVYGKLTLVPSEERIPSTTGYIIAPENIISPIEVAIAAQPEVEYLPPAVAFTEFSPFQAPLISRLELNKWYVQVGTYGRAEFVEDEISRIGTDYPLAVQNVGTDTNPLFRILLGPLNQGESGAMLQRFKSLGYADAFVRYN
jgi:cell division septation protein DedD